MKLSKKDKDELRKSVEVLLKASPDNKKIQLSNETLEQLLFDTYVVNKEKGIKVKLPVWSGDFLRKLDLSRVSFEDVSWGMLYDSLGIEIYEDYPIDEEFFVAVEQGKIDFGVYVDEDNPICYANTNVKIDFSKSFDAKNGQYINVNGCNFSNVDLSNSAMNAGNKKFSIIGSNFSNTNIKFPNMELLYAISTNLANNDLTGLEFNAVDAMIGDQFFETNLTNTGTKIVLDMEKLQSKYDEHYDSQYYQNWLKEYIENYWVGCYLNGKLIKASEEKKQSAEITREEYEQYKRQKFADILNSIAEQMDNSGPKK